MTDANLGAADGSRGRAELPEPAGLLSRRVLGPSAIVAAVAIGSGELLFWPNETLVVGAGVLTLALAALLVQWVVDVEIARYSMATGESVVSGVARRVPLLGHLLLVGAIVPWLWPGWARQGSELLSPVVDTPEPLLSVLVLAGCGLLLLTPQSVYAVVERVQATLLVVILLGAVALLVATVAVVPGTASFSGDLLAGKGLGATLAEAASQSDERFLGLIGGLVFAGAGGTLNLGYGLLVCEKGYAMGRYSQPIAGIVHSHGLGSPTLPAPETEGATFTRRWRRWMFLARSEHAMLFFGTNAASILCISAMYYHLFDGRVPEGATGGFLSVTQAALQEQVGPWAAGVYLIVAVGVFVTSELGILDFAGRLCAGIVTGLVAHRRRVNPSRIFQATIAGMVLVGSLLILVADPRSPYWYLVTSASLNTLVMASYFVIVAWANRRLIGPGFRGSRAVTGAVVLCGLIYGALFAAIVVRVL